MPESTPLPIADEVRDGFGNLKKIGKIMVSYPFIHGKMDDIIPMSNGLALLVGGKRQRYWGSS